jgi:hypothetical protein
MAKVKITGHASGTGIFTVTAPNSNTDRTITLPDGTGTLAFTTGDDDKLPLAGGTMTGALHINAHTNSITTTGNDDNLQLISTDTDANVGPNLLLYRNSASPADGDVLGEITFDGRQDGGGVRTYGSLITTLQDASDGTEDGKIELKTIVAGSIIRRLSIGSSPAEVVINDDSIDSDFRVESDNNTDALFVQGSDGNVGIGTDSPASPLHITRSTNDITGAKLTLNNPHTGNGDYGSTIAFHAGTGGSGTTDTNIGNITCYKKDNTNGSKMRFQVQTGDFSGIDTILELDDNGRGVSQFTAKAWCSFMSDSGPSFRDSHNCSSITDHGVGDLSVNMSVAMGQNTAWSVVASCGQSGTNPSDKSVAASPVDSDTFRLEIYNITAATHYDMAFISAIVFGD